MASLNPEYVKAVRELLKEAPYFNLIGMVMESLEPGRCLFRLETARRHLQPFGMAHGGALASVLDAACFWSAFSQLEQGDALTTTDLKINYLAPAPPGLNLLVSGESIKTGRTLCLSQARAEDGDTGGLIAFATSTLMIMDYPAGSGFQELPLKFIG